MKLDDFKKMIEKQLNEGKNDYKTYHNSFSSAVQEAENYAIKNGYEVNKDDWWSEISTGPKKPNDGQTNKYTIKLIKKYGIRNAVILSIAPTGTISMVAGTSSGIEPIFAPMTKRRYRVENSFAEEIIVDSMFSEAVNGGGDWKHIVGAYDVTPEEHIAVQAAVQDYVDQAISKTINVPESFTYEELMDLILEYSDRLKGLTIYRAGSREGEPLKAIPTTEHKVELYARKKELVGTATQSCATGSCEI